MKVKYKLNGFDGSKKQHGPRVHYIVTNIHSLTYSKRYETLQNAYFHHTQQILISTTKNTSTEYNRTK